MRSALNLLFMAIALFVSFPVHAKTYLMLPSGLRLYGMYKNCGAVVAAFNANVASGDRVISCEERFPYFDLFYTSPTQITKIGIGAASAKEECDGSRFSMDEEKEYGQRCVRLKCNDGDALGSYKVATAYWQINPRLIKQPIMADADAKNYKVCIEGCVARTTSVSGCNDARVVSPNLELVSCTLAMEETSQKCSIWGDPSEVPPFNGSVGPGDGSGTGNETPDPNNPGGGTGGTGGTPGGGTGGTPGGGTGGTPGGGDGGTPGGGTGGTPGGGTGGTPGGGTGGDGGTPGGGTGGTPGGGNGGTPGGGAGDGKAQENCGAPGQPACRIDEGGMKSVHGDEGDSQLSNIDYHNKNALDQIGSVVKDKLMYGDWFPTINTAVCTNPQVPSPFGSGTFEVNICTYVEIFAKFITGVICFFAVIGSVQQVTSAAKA